MAPTNQAIILRIQAQARQAEHPSHIWKTFPL